MAKILDQMTTERKRLLLTNLLIILGDDYRLELEVRDLDGLDFEAGRYSEGTLFYLTLKEGAPHLRGHSYSVNRHHGGHDTCNRYESGVLPKESVDTVYSKVRSAVINHLTTEQKVEQRTKENKEQLRVLIQKYGIPEDLKE